MQKKVFTELEDWDSASNKIVIVKGAGGAGKSVTCRQLAYDIYTKLGVPTLLPRVGGEAMDTKLLDGIIDEFKIETERPTKDGVSKIIDAPKIAVLVDDGAFALKRLRYVVNSLTSAGKRILFVVFCRSDELLISDARNPSERDIISLPDTISVEEQKDLVQQVKKLGINPPENLVRTSIIEARSFFSTIYYHNYLCRETLEECVAQEYNAQSELVRKAYDYVCAVGRFGVYLNIGLLVRLSEISLSEFVSGVLKKAGEEILVEYPGPSGELLWGPRSRTVAEIIARRMHHDEEYRLELIKDIINESIPGYRTEEVTLTVLLLGRILIYGDAFSLSEKRIILDTYLMRGFKDRAVIHHYGLMELNEATRKTSHISEIGLNSAETMLNRALGIPITNADASRFESDQNIYTSLGVLYSWRVQIAESNNQPALADAVSEKAEDYFRKGMRDILNGHAYHAMANMYYHRGNRTADDLAKAELYSKSLDVIASGKAILPVDQVEILLELESKILAKWNRDDKLKAALETLAEKYKNPKGHYIKALFNYKSLCSNPELNDKKKRNSLIGIKDILEAGLSINPDAADCLSLLADIQESLEPRNLDPVYNTLKKLWSISTTTPNLKALFKLLRVALLLKRYSVAKNILNELNGNSLGHPSRYRRYLLKDPTGIPLKYKGVVSKIESRAEGYVYCDELREFTTEIIFSVQRQKFTIRKRQQVEFQLNLRYQRPQAVNLQPIT